VARVILRNEWGNYEFVGSTGNDKSFSQPARYPGWGRGIGTGYVGFDVQYRGAVYGIEADDFEDIIPAFEKFNGSYTNGVGTCRTAGGEDTDQRQLLVAFGMDFHYGTL